MLQYVTVCYSMLQYVTVCYSMLQYVTVCYSMLQYVTVCYSMLQYVTVCYSMLQYVTVLQWAPCLKPTWTIEPWEVMDFFANSFSKLKQLHLGLMDMPLGKQLLPAKFAEASQWWTPVAAVGSFRWGQRTRNGDENIWKLNFVEQLMTFVETDRKTMKNPKLYSRPTQPLLQAPPLVSLQVIPWKPSASTRWSSMRLEARRRWLEFLGTDSLQ